MNDLDPEYETPYFEDETMSLLRPSRWIIRWGRFSGEFLPRDGTPWEETAEKGVID